MLTPDQVLPFLQHQDPAVRDHALTYLVGSMDCGPTTADDLWRSIDQFGMAASEMCLRHLHHVPQTQASYTRLIAALSQVTDESQRASLEAAFMDLSWDLLDQNRDEILSLSSAPGDLRRHHARRLALDALPFDELWSALTHVAEAEMDGESEAEDEREDDDDTDDVTDEDDNTGEDDEDGADDDDEMDGTRLVETLIRRFPQVAGERAIAVTRAIPPTGKTGWLEDYCVDILGRTKHYAAVPLLLEQLSVCGDEIQPAIAQSLARLGNADLVSRLEAIYADETSEVQCSTVIGILQSINIPQTEAALARLLHLERDLDLRRELAGSLLDLCASPEALEEVRHLIASDLRYHGSERFARRVLPAAVMVGLEWPELTTWRDEIEKRKARRTSPLGFNSPAVTAEQMNNAPLSEPALADLSAVQPVETIRRSTPRVGRNDACPCGSGKKYKKCCMNP